MEFQKHEPEVKPKCTCTRQPGFIMQVMDCLKAAGLEESAWAYFQRARHTPAGAKTVALAQKYVTLEFVS
jgi:hypothetical protein